MFHNRGSILNTKNSSGAENYCDGNIVTLLLINEQIEMLHDKIDGFIANVVQLVGQNVLLFES